MDRIEATLDRLTAITAQTAERQSMAEYRLDQLTIKMDRLNDTVEKVVVAVTADGENIRALARIAEAHQRRIENLESPS